MIYYVRVNTNSHPAVSWVRDDEDLKKTNELILTIETKHKESGIMKAFRKEFITYAVEELLAGSMEVVSTMPVSLFLQLQRDASTEM